MYSPVALFSRLSPSMGFFSCAEEFAIARELFYLRTVLEEEIHLCGNLEYLPPANEVWGKVRGRGVHASSVCVGGVCIQWGLGRPAPSDTTGYGQQAGGTYPTGMHCCHAQFCTGFGILSNSFFVSVQRYNFILSQTALMVQTC